MSFQMQNDNLYGDAYFWNTSYEPTHLQFNSMANTDIESETIDENISNESFKIEIEPAKAKIDVKEIEVINAVKELKEIIKEEVEFKEEVKDEIKEEVKDEVKVKIKEKELVMVINEEVTVENEVNDIKVECKQVLKDISGLSKNSPIKSPIKLEKEEIKNISKEESLMKSRSKNQETVKKNNTNKKRKKKH